MGVAFVTVVTMMYCMYIQFRYVANSHHCSRLAEDINVRWPTNELLCKPFDLTYVPAILYSEI